MLLLDINSSLAKRKRAQLRIHGYFACGSLPLNDDDGPHEMRGLSLNSVRHAHRNLGTQLANR